MIRQDFDEKAIAQAVQAALLRLGVATSAELQRATGKSQASMSRALAELAPQVVAIGRARARRYILPQPILGRSGEQPLFVTVASGHSTRWGTLFHLEGQRVHVASIDNGYQLTTQGALPWFLEPLRPQGFLGRLRGLSMGFGDANPESWTLDQVLYTLLSHEHDNPGAFTLGDERGELLPEAPVDPVARGRYYDEIARDITKAPRAGSSAGGEQPKFLAHINLPSGYERLIVKFSPPRGTPFGERWHDLLHTEHLAGAVLRAHGFAAATTHILQSERHTYLESVRFDRVGAFGKRHVVPLGAIHRAWVAGPQQHWAVTANSLSARGYLSTDDAAKIATIREFGRLIGNTDMHFGNLSLLVHDLQKLSSPRFQLAPIYDMLSMAYKPGEFRDDLGYAQLPEPRPPLGDAGEWEQALKMAREFWMSLADSPAVSAGMRAVAGSNLKTVETCISSKTAK